MDLNSSVINLHLPPHKKIYFASDFHLGAPNSEESLKRELKIIQWLDFVAQDASHIFLVGDIFDFWFEYKQVIPKGFLRFQAKLVELINKGIQLIFFTGNHDLWLFDYFTKELQIPIFREPQTFLIQQKKILIGHGDGLGPGDRNYKFLKKIFKNKVFQTLFSFIHPDVGIALANFWSRNSRAKNKQKEEVFLGEKEWLWQYCKQLHITNPHDFYIFGHRHLPLELAVGDASIYINLGEWINFCSYAYYDGHGFYLTDFKP